MLVITGLGVGGAERLLVGIADRFVNLGHEVIIVRLQGDAEMRPSDSRVRLVNLRIKRNPFSVIAGASKFLQIVREFSPDVVNSHLVHANIFTRVARLLTLIPRLVTSAHNTNEEGRLKILGYRLTDRLADISTNVSEEAVKAFEAQGAVKPGRMVTVHNGIDTREFSVNEASRSAVRSELGIGACDTLLISVGRLREANDYPNLLRAFAAIKESVPGAQLTVLGDGPLREQLCSLVRALKLEDRVTFLGVRHDVVELLSAADLFVLSSAWEGMPMVIMEAMACGLVPVVTDCGGTKGVVGDAGFVVPPHDSDALADALKNALGLEGKEKERLSDEARNRVVEQFSLNATVERYLQLYKGNSSGLESEEPA